MVWTANGGQTPNMFIHSHERKRGSCIDSCKAVGHEMDPFVSVAFISLPNLLSQAFRSLLDGQVGAYCVRQQGIVRLV